MEANISMLLREEGELGLVEPLNDLIRGQFKGNSSCHIFSTRGKKKKAYILLKPPVFETGNKHITVLLSPKAGN